ncbi:MAG: hypothetical protein WDA53_01065 [Bacillota bacterium]
MEKRISKILLSVLGIAAVAGLVFYYSITNLFDSVEKLFLEDISLPESELNPKEPLPILVEEGNVNPEETETDEPRIKDKSQVNIPETHQRGNGDPVKSQQGEEHRVTKPAEAIETGELQKEETSRVEELGSRISFEDKRRMLLLITKNLKSEDIKYLTSLLSGGFTPGEKQSAVELALKRFDEEDLKELQLLFNKYKEYIY